MICDGFRVACDQQSLDNLHLFKRFIFGEHSVPLPKCLLDLEVP